jgi:hypothetical protein
MQTVREQNMIAPGFGTSISNVPVPDSQLKRLKIREFGSWAACFGVIAGLTGMIKIMKIGITMDSVTSAMFYSSLLALAFCVYRIISLVRMPVSLSGNQRHELN